MTVKNRYYNPSLAHHTPEGFTNPEPHPHEYGDFKRWQRERKAQQLPKPPRMGYQQFIAQWWQKADFSGTDDRLWFLGHACLLLRIAGKTVLTDPALSDRASPLRFYGPKRKTPVAAGVADLPHIDYIVLSHNHYDHLDKTTIKQLLRRFPQLIFIVPLGMKRWLERQGAHHVEELDWWQQHKIGGLTFHAVPARHWSMRTPWDRNRSLWCGWVVASEVLRFYFSGDSGYSNQFKEIGNRLGPFDLAAIPIGAYAPRWFMNAQHMDPQQAVTVFSEVKCRKAVPIHWGVFELADESLDEPLLELAQAKEGHNHVDPHFVALKIGQSILPD